MIQRTTIDLTECTAFHRALAAPKPSFPRRVLVALVALVAGALLWSYCTVTSRTVSAAGRVRPLDAPQAPLSEVSGKHVTSAIAGRVAAVHFTWGGNVVAGQVLAELETEHLQTDMRALQEVLADADAELAHQERLIEDLRRREEVEQRLLKTKIAEAKESITIGKATREAKIRSARAELEQRVRERDRLDRLQSRLASAVSTEERERSGSTSDVATARLLEVQVPVAEAHLETLLAESEASALRNRIELGQMERHLHERRGERNARRRQLAEKESLLRRSVIRTPCTGLVTSGLLQVGDQVEPKQILATVVAQADELRMDVLVPHHDIGRIRPGMPARVKLNAWDHQKYGTLPAEVRFIAPDAEGSGFLVNLSLTDHCLRGHEEVQVVKIGMTGTAEIVVEEDRLLNLGIRWFREQASVPIR
jgi:multidrug efflux pump subunit AcrA (membrane-fusion protein)